MLPDGQLVLAGVMNGTAFEWGQRNANGALVATAQELAIVGGSGAYVKSRGRVGLENLNPNPPGFGRVVVKVYFQKE